MSYPNYNPFDFGAYTHYTELLTGNIDLDQFSTQCCEMPSSSRVVPNLSQHDVIGSPVESVVRLADIELVQDEDEDDDPDYTGGDEQEDDDDDGGGGGGYEDGNEEEHADDDVGDGVGNDVESMDVDGMGLMDVPPFMTQPGTDELYRQYSGDTVTYPGDWIPEYHEPFVGLIFKTREMVKEGMDLWADKRRVRHFVKYAKSKYWDVRCASCAWRFRACLRKRSRLWECSIYNGPHTCTNGRIDGNHPHLTSNLIAKVLQHDISQNPNMNIKAVKLAIHARWQCEVSYRKAWLGKQKAITSVFGNWEESYAKLPKFLQALKTYNPGTVVDYSTISHYPVGGIFDKLFFTFPQVVEAFVHCRPVIVIDGTHMYGKYKGKIFLAMAVDADNSTFPIACAFVDEESEETWTFFLVRLMHYVVKSRPNVVLVSDRHKGILTAVSKVWESVGHVHRYCSHHFFNNFKTNFKGEPELHNMANNAIYTYQEKKFEVIMTLIKDLNQEAYDWLVAEPLQKWSRVYDRGCRFGIMTSNNAESMNAVLLSARSLPITAAVQVIFLKIVGYFCKRRDIAAKMRLNRADYCVGFWKDIGSRVLEKSHSATCYVTGKLYSVKTGNRYSRGGNVHRVNLEARTCDCGKWQADSFPCSHVACVCEVENSGWEYYASPYYRIEFYESTYAPIFMPLADEAYWVNVDVVMLPNKERIRSVGRPRKRIHNGMDVSQRRERITCSVCNGRGHDSRTCSNPNRRTRVNHPIGVPRR